MASFGKLALTIAAAGSVAAADDDRVRRAFNAYKVEFQRSYSSLAEEEARYEIFKASYAYVEKQNAKGASFKLAVNEFADQSPDEFAAGRLGLSAPAPGKLWVGLPHLGTDTYSGAPLEDSVDWTSKGAVTKPKNQGQCGSCWAFSSTGALEGAWKIAKGELVSLSEQQLVDCAKDLNGCHGGAMDPAFKYVSASGLCTEDSYSYGAKEGTCQASNCTAGIPKEAVTGFKDVPVDDEKALMEAVSQQPVSVAIEADQMAFQLYKSGVLTKECGNKLDHGVLLVGYGTDNGVDYWKVKNSWGPQWGEDGFIRLERGGKSKDGECGIQMGASYPVVGTAVEAATIVV